VSAIGLDIVSTFRKMSTKPDQVHAVEKRGSASGRVRMGVIPDFKAATLTGFITQHLAPDSTIYTDGLKQFTALPAKGYAHLPARSRGRASSAPVPHRWCPWLIAPLATSNNGSSAPITE
jgi:hypothetical protein